MPRVGGTFENGKGAGEAIQRDASVILRELDVEMRNAVRKDLLPILRKETPEAAAGSLTKGSLSRFEGELRQAWASIPGAPTPGADTVIYNSAPHANLIIPGRRKRKRGTGVVGSWQARRPIVRASLKQLEGSEESATARVVAEVERRLG